MRPNFHDLLKIPCSVGEQNKNGVHASAWRKAATMVEKPPGSAIPDEVRDAFDQAVSQLIQWNDGSEPTISVKGDAETISKVATLAEPFKDTMPASVYWRMAAYANSSFERRASAVQLSKDSSYSTGAWCLREWIEDKKVRFDRV